MRVIARNFLKLLAHGAFGPTAYGAGTSANASASTSTAATSLPPLEPMSPFKWQQLRQLAEAYSVADYMPWHSTATPASPSAPADSPSATFSNPLLNLRLRRIEYKEIHSIDTSTTTLDFLRTLIANANVMMQGDSNLRGIIAIGQWLRTDGDQIDYVKLNRWTVRLGMTGMADLIGSHLASLFAFEDDELPFMRHRTNTYEDTLTTLTNALATTHPQKTSDAPSLLGAIHSPNTKAARYLRQNPIEALSRVVANISKSIREIEE